MPVEIRELVIKATIVRDLNGSAAQSNGVPPTEQLVKVCIEKVLEILKEKDER